MLAEHNENIPVVRGDMPDTWIHGFESMPIETKTGCNIRPLETAVASLDTHLKMAGVATPPLAAALATAYEHSLLYGEHTFGFYGSQPGGFWYGDEWKQKRKEGRYARFEQSFNDKRAYIHKTAEIVHKAIDERLDLLAKNVDAAGPRIVVFNALPWDRSGEVVVDNAPGGPWSAVRDPKSGATAPILGHSGTMVVFEATAVPATGRKTYQLVAGPPIAKKHPAGDRGTIENASFRLRVIRPAAESYR